MKKQTLKKQHINFITITCGFCSYLEIANKRFLDTKEKSRCIIKNSFELIEKNLKNGKYGGNMTLKIYTLI